PPEVLKRLETEILAAAIDHINDHRYRTLAPMEIETEVDIFTLGMVVDPTFGEFEEELKQQDLDRKRGPAAKSVRKENKDEVHFMARVSTSEGLRETPLTLIAGGRRLNVGRGTDNDLYLNQASVSKIHSALNMDEDGVLLLADTGSPTGTRINGVRIAYGEARPS